jgi:hypothetical protein
MNRRHFFNSLIGGIAATAAVRTWPFRVYSFPSDLTWAGTDITVYSQKELDDVVSKYEATQEPEWAALIRSLPDSELARDPTWNRL